MADLDFDKPVEEMADDYYEGGKLLPPGWTTLVIVDENIKQNSSGTGTLLTLLYEHESGGKYKDMFNITHKNETTQKIARGKLSKLAIAIGHKGKLTTTNVLFGRPFQAFVEVEEFQGREGEKIKVNKFAKFRPVSEASLGGNNQHQSQTSSKIKKAW